jgi:hypothetical protein
MLWLLSGPASPCAAGQADGGELKVIPFHLPTTHPNNNLCQVYNSFKKCRLKLSLISPTPSYYRHPLASKRSKITKNTTPCPSSHPSTYLQPIQTIICANYIIPLKPHLKLSLISPTPYTVDQHFNPGCGYFPRSRGTYLFQLPVDTRCSIDSFFEHQH